MGLKLKAKACFLNKCTSLSLTDITGEHDAAANPGGWGTPNVDVGDVTEATIKIIHPDGTEQEMDVSSQVPSVYNGNFYYTYIVPASSGSFSDGLYEIHYTVVADDTTYEYVCYLASLCSVWCCYQDHLKKLPQVMCEQCDYEKYYQDMQYMGTMLKALLYAEWCGRKIEVV